MSSSASRCCHDRGGWPFRPWADGGGRGERMTMQKANRPGVDKMAPLSREQEQLWSRQRLTERATAGSTCTAVQMPAPLDIDALRESLTDFIQRHEIWRTAFPILEGTPQQVVQTDGGLAWSEADLSELAEDDRQEALRGLGE